MSEALNRFDHLHAGAYLARRTLPIQNTTVRPGSLYGPTHGVKAYYTMWADHLELTDGPAFYGMMIVGTKGAEPSHLIERMEKLRRDLGRLQDGWCGAGSLAPSSQALVDLDTLLLAIPTNAADPEVEVDETTGFVTLRWVRPNHPAGFSFVLRGDRRALGVKTEFAPPRVTSKSFDLRNEQPALARYLDSDPVISGTLAAA